MSTHTLSSICIAIVLSLLSLLPLSAEDRLSTDFYTNSQEITLLLVPTTPGTTAQAILFGYDREGTKHDFTPQITLGDTLKYCYSSLTYPKSRPERGYNFQLWHEGLKVVKIVTNPGSNFKEYPSECRPIVVFQKTGAQNNSAPSQNLAYQLYRHTDHEVWTITPDRKGQISAADKQRLDSVAPILFVVHDERALSYCKDENHPSYKQIPVYIPVGAVESQVEDVRRLLGEDSEKRCAFRPIPQQRDSYDWQERHRNVLKVNIEEPPTIVLIGNSITHYWAGAPAAQMVRGADSWNSLWQDKVAHNLGFGWDRVENALWRINHGEIDGFKAEKVLLLLGTNNLAYNSAEDIAGGIVEVVRSVHRHQPGAEIIVCSILPRTSQSEKVAPANKAIRQALSELDLPVRYLDLTSMAFDANGKFRTNLFSDGLHPNTEGYRTLGTLLQKLLK